MSAIPFLSLQHQHAQIRTEMEQAFARVLDRSRFILDEEVVAFEHEFAQYHPVAYCVGVASGMDALYISLVAAGIGSGHEVIVPAHTFFATWLAVSRTGATPVPVDVNEQDFTINTAALRQAIGSRTKAIIAVHLYGHPCDMPAIMSLAEQHDLLVIEDNAQAHGAHHSGRKTGTWGHINAISFYPTKNMGALGDAGAILTNNDTYHQFIKAFRNYGSPEKDVYQHQGINSRLDELQAAVLRIKLRWLDTWNHERQTIASQYNTLLHNIGDVVVPPSATRTVTPVFHQYVIRTTHRDALKDYLETKGIGTAIHYPTPIHLQPAYKALGYHKGSFPITEAISDTILSLPVWPGLLPQQVESIASTIREFFDHQKISG